MKSLKLHRIKKKRDSGNSEQIQKVGGWHEINNPGQEIELKLHTEPKTQNIYQRFSRKTARAREP